MSLRKAAQQALNALELGCTDHEGNEVDLVGPAITALRAALSEPTCQESRHVEPVAWRFYDGKIWCYVNHISDLSASTKFEPLYPAPPKREPLTESFLEALAEKHVTNCYFDTLTYARAIERAHDIGDEE